MENARKMHYIFREIDKLLFGVFTKLIFWNTHSFVFPRKGIKKHNINEYPIKILKLHRKK